jgi:hypothetical protein
MGPAHYFSIFFDGSGGYFELNQIERFFFQLGEHGHGTPAALSRCVPLAINPNDFQRFRLCGSPALKNTHTRCRLSRSREFKPAAKCNLSTSHENGLAPTPVPKMGWPQLPTPQLH